MKDALKRAAQAVGLLATDPVAEAVVTTVEATVADAEGNVVLSTAAAEGLVALADAVEAAPNLQAQLDAQTAELATALAQATDLQAALTSVTAELMALKAANAKAEADAVATKLAKRKELIVAALGTDRADAFMAATAGMPDEQFATVAAAMNISVTAEAESAAFTEQGVDAQANVEALQAEAAGNGTLAILQAKYQQTEAN